MPRTRGGTKYGIKHSSRKKKKSSKHTSKHLGRRLKLSKSLYGRPNVVPFCRQIDDQTIDLSTYAKAYSAAQPALRNSAYLEFDNLTANIIPDFRELQPVFQRYKVTQITVKMYPIYDDIDAVRSVIPTLNTQNNMNMLQTRINTKWWLDQDAVPQYGQDVMNAVNQMPKQETTVYGGKRPLVMRTKDPRNYMEITDNEGPGYTLDTSTAPPTLIRNTKTVSTYGRWHETEAVDVKWIHNDAILFRPVDSAYVFANGTYRFRVITTVDFLCSGYH